MLTYSRGGVLAAFVALVGWFALTRARFESLAAIVAGGVPAAIACGIALVLPGIAQDGQSHSVRVHDGAWFALAFVLGAGAAFAAAWFLRYRPGPERERVLLRAAAGVAIACVLAGVIVASRRAGTRWAARLRSARGRAASGRAASTTAGAGGRRLGMASGQSRSAGPGPGRSRSCTASSVTRAVDVLETHDLPLQFASETGIVGVVLWIGAMGAALLGAWRALGRLEGDEREAALALGLVVPAFLVHGLLDYDWDFVALAGPLAVRDRVSVSGGSQPVRVGRHYGWVAAVVLVAWAGLYSIAAPRIAAARVDDAYSQIERGRLGQAASSAKSAHSLNPLSIAALQAWASVEEDAGNLARARQLYAQAVDLQPLELGELVPARALRPRGARAETPRRGGS